MNQAPLTLAERRILGRFDTPRPLAQSVTDWAIRNRRDLVLEPSVGGGIFALSAVARLKTLGVKQPHTQVVACDIDQRALAETNKNMPETPPLLAKGNFLELGLQELGGRQFDVVVGNPPYVRLHSMSESSRLAARRSLPSPNLLGAKASLWAYFPIHAFKMLKTGGRMAWILPEALFHVDYGRQLLTWAGENFRRCRAVSLRERCFQSEGTKERVVILLLEGAGKPAPQKIEITEHESAKECISALATMSADNNSVLPQLNGHAVPHLISSEASSSAHALETCSDLTTLGTYADIKIGVVTGDNGFFVLSEMQRKQQHLRPHHFLPIVNKFSDLGAGFINRNNATDGDLCRNLLLCPNPESNDLKLAAYLASYPAEAQKTNQTMGKRPYWQCPQLGLIPDAFLRYMGKVGPRLVINRSKSYCTNTIHAIFFKANVSAAQRKAICLALHSTYSQLSAEFEGRQYNSGVLKLEPSEAKKIRLPVAPQALVALQKAWRTLAAKAERNGWETVVKQIDYIILSHSPLLAQALPIDRAKRILQQVRQRRTGNIIAPDKVHQ